MSNRVIKSAPGWPMLFLNFIMYVGAVYLTYYIATTDDAAMIPFMIILFIVAALVSAGFFIVNPNYAALLVLFGKYKGTVDTNGFWWANPLMRKVKISRRVRNHETSRLKVNEKSGNPVEIAAIVVWKVIDPYKAQFEVDAYEEYVRLQTESALRNMATNYHYDGADHEVTLRGSTDEVNDELQSELKARLHHAGVQVLEARLAHLAYAPEIASEMLRRQQATAVVAARTKIVEGAVGMVEHALEELGRKAIVQLDEERKATMVSNLLVVLCSESSATPVVNAGTLYQ
jgi:regulator of protease activity HflC (stomatin/prohibitin superfamily)